MNRPEHSPASSSSAPPADLRPDPSDHSASASLQQALAQAQHDCQARHWLKVIQHCETIIATCHECIRQEAASSSERVTASASNALSADADQTSLSALHQVKGDLFKREGQIDQAIQAYQQALQHQPEHGGTHAKLAEIYIQRGQLEDAIAHYQKALSVEPGFEKAQLKLAKLYIQSQQWDSAIQCCETALSLEPEHAKFQQLLWQARVKQCEKVLSSDPDNPRLKKSLGEAYFEMGRRLLFQKQRVEAGFAYLNAIQYCPRLGHAYSGLRHDAIIGHKIEGKDLGQSRLLTKTINVCQQIVRTHPDILAAHKTLGYALTISGDVPAASQCYRRVNKQIAYRQILEPTHRDDAQYYGPNFIVIGAQKSGTTSLYQYLSRHPQIVSPVEKEINFFSSQHERGLDWYLSNFPPLPKRQGWITGDVSPNYLYDYDAPCRVFNNFPKIQLAVILRNPVDRAVSLYQMMARKVKKKSSFAEVVSQEIELLSQKIDQDDIPRNLIECCPHIGRGLYYHHLQRWLKFFSREQLLVIQSENLLQHPDSVLNNFYQVLGLNHHSEAEYPKYHAGSYSPIDEELYQELSQFFEPQNRRLENLLGYSFSW